MFFIWCLCLWPEIPRIVHGKYYKNFLQIYHFQALFQALQITLKLSYCTCHLFLTNCVEPVIWIWNRSMFSKLNDLPAGNLTSSHCWVNVRCQCWITVEICFDFANLINVEIATSFQRHVFQHRWICQNWINVDSYLDFANPINVEISTSLKSCFSTLTHYIFLLVFTKVLMCSTVAPVTPNTLKWIDN